MIATRASALFLTAITIVTTSPPADAQDSSKAAMHPIDSQILDIVTRLSTATSLGPTGVAAMADARLVHTPASSTAYFDVFSGRGNAGSFAAEVEVRAPREGTRAKGPLVLITLREQETLDASQVIARFGPPASIRVPPPEAAAATGAAIYAWPQKIGTLRFGVGPGPAQKILSVVIDRTE